MNKLRFNCILVCTSLAFIFVSCADNKDKSADATSADTTTNKAEPSVTTANIDTTLQTIMIVRHKIAGYAKFKSSYDAADSLRLANGIHSYVIGRGVDDSNMVMVAVKADDLAKAKAFSNSAGLKMAMQKSGIIGKPTISIATVVYQDMSQNMSDLRSLTFFNVKDWDKWKSSFESYRQLRTDNGITDRAYGYDPDDNKKVTLAVAINDSAKAEAYWNGDLIKQKRAESGVIGAPERFVYRVVQRY